MASSVCSSIFSSNAAEIAEILKKHVKTIKEENTEVFDGTGIQNSIFPEINANVFISHSHKDIELARNLAGWLEHRFKIKSFIDSDVWGCSSNLIESFSDFYIIESKRNIKNYRKVIDHVNMMLSVALSQMINKTECVIFLNTPSSISVDDKTDSPWIYHELFFSKVVARIPPNRSLRTLNENVSFGEKKSASSDITIKYDAPMTHLIEIEDEILTQWEKLATNDPMKNLDNLYKIVQWLERK